MQRLGAKGWFHGSGISPRGRPTSDPAEGRDHEKKPNRSARPSTSPDPRQQGARRQPARRSDRRELHVYTPHGYKDGARLPLLVDVVGFTGSGMGHTNWKAFTENVPERLDRLIGEGKMGPVVVAFPDCFTRLGGNQYINWAALGRYEDYLIQEIVPFVEGRFSAAAKAIAASSASRRAGSAPSPMACGTATSGRRWPATPATWLSSSATCTTCRRR